MMRGHKRGCRCVGCSPATRAKGMRALRSGKPKARKTRPPVSRARRRNAPSLHVVGTIPGRLQEIRYQRTGKRPGPYKHTFGRGVQILALSDGSIVLRGRRRLWGKE